nr:hypothetical protein [Leptospira interrogans]
MPPAYFFLEYTTESVAWALWYIMEERYIKAPKNNTFNNIDILFTIFKGGTLLL